MLGAVQLNSSLLAVSVIAVLLPAAFHLSLDNNDGAEGQHILSVSRGVSVLYEKMPHRAFDIFCLLGRDHSPFQ